VSPEQSAAEGDGDRARGAPGVVVANRGGEAPRRRPSRDDRACLRTLDRGREQDLVETAEGKFAIRQAVAEDRQISVEDSARRYGRGSRTKRFGGRREPIACDLDLPVILPVAVTPANRPEEEGARPLADDIARQGLTLREVRVDHAYVDSDVMDEVRARRRQVCASPGRSVQRVPGCFRRPTSPSTCAPKRSRAPRDRSSPPSPAKRSTSTPRRAARAPGGRDKTQLDAFRTTVVAW
jgi:hypothetical protein